MMLLLTNISLQICQVTVSIGFEFWTSDRESEEAEQMNVRSYGERFYQFNKVTHVHW